MLLFLVKSDQSITERNNSKISEKTGLVLYTWKKEKKRKKRPKAKKNKVESEFGFLQTYSLFSHCSTELETYSISWLWKGKGFSTLHILSSIIAITWATTSVRQSLIFSSLSWPLCMCWKECHFGAFPCAFTCMAHCDFAVICLSCPMGTDFQEEVGKCPRHFRPCLICLLYDCCQKLRSISPQSLS